jgi:hypothetical protein
VARVIPDPPVAAAPALRIGAPNSGARRSWSAETLEVRSFLARLTGIQSFATYSYGEGNEAAFICLRPGIKVAIHGPRSKKVKEQ